jgi:hypothetical protein
MGQSLRRQISIPVRVPARGTTTESVHDVSAEAVVDASVALHYLDDDAKEVGYVFIVEGLVASRRYRILEEFRFASRCEPDRFQVTACLHEVLTASKEGNVINGTRLRQD